MRVTVLGEPGGPLAGDLAARLAAAGADVVTPPRDPDAIEAFEADVRRSDAGIDACVADQGLKLRHVALLDRCLPAESPLVTCCHAASATAVAAGTGHPERVVGFACLAPWGARRTVECARGLRTADGAAAAAEAVWRAIGFEPVWVGDSTGLVLPRIVACLANEAFFALMEGTATAAGIDRAMRLGTRYPRGPLAWAGHVGLDHVLATLDALAREHGDDRYRAAPLLRRLVTAGLTLDAVAPGLEPADDPKEG